MRNKIIIGSLAVLAAFAIACGAGSKSPTQGPGYQPGTNAPTGENGGAAQTGHTVLFEVSGPATANSISYGIGGNMSQANGAALPWSKEATSSDAFLLVSLVAQSGSGGGDSITCRVTVDGTVLVENTSSGAYAVVTCSGSR